MPASERRRLTHIDGTPIFQTDADRAKENRVAAQLEQAWGCRVKPFAPLCPIDWYTQREDRVTGVLELKSRMFASGQFPTVFFSVRKYLALTFASISMNCPAAFVANLRDGIFWLPLTRIDAQRVRVAGDMAVVRGANAIEPLIEVPIDSMRRL